jgi:hypothetical protein
VAEKIIVYSNKIIEGNKSEGMKREQKNRKY